MVVFFFFCEATLGSALTGLLESSRSLGASVQLDPRHLLINWNTIDATPSSTCTSACRRRSAPRHAESRLGERASSYSPRCRTIEIARYAYRPPLYESFDENTRRSMMVVVVVVVRGRKAEDLLYSLPGHLLLVRYKM